MEQATTAMLLAISLVSPQLNTAQDASWRHYDGDAFSFSYPTTWRAKAQVDQDVIVADLAHPISVEFAVSPGQPGSAEKLAVNAEKHVLQFAQMNNMFAKFESANQIDGGGVKVTSHLCSLPSGNEHFCASNDPKVIDVSSVIWGMNGRILLVEMMHSPGLAEAQVDAGRQIVRTFKLKG